MKRLVNIFVVAVFALASVAVAADKKPAKAASTASAKTVVTQAPAATTFTLVGADGNLLFSYDKKTSTLTVKAPVSSDQLKANGGSVKGIKMYVSHASLENNEWVLKGRKTYDDHVTPTSVNSHITATIKLADDMKKVSKVWFRMWGQDKAAPNKAAGEWLWILQTQYSRNDKQNNPGYEFILDPATGGIASVPAAYQTRL